MRSLRQTRPPLAGGGGAGGVVLLDCRAGLPFELVAGEVDGQLGGVLIRRVEKSVSPRRKGNVRPAGGAIDDRGRFPSLAPAADGGVGSAPGNWVGGGCTECGRKAGVERRHTRSGGVGTERGTLSRLQ